MDKNKKITIAVSVIVLMVVLGYWFFSSLWLFRALREVITSSVSNKILTEEEKVKILEDLTAPSEKETISKKQKLVILKSLSASSRPNQLPRDEALKILESLSAQQ